MARTQQQSTGLDGLKAALDALSPEQKAALGIQTQPVSSVASATDEDGNLIYLAAGTGRPGRRVAMVAYKVKGGYSEPGFFVQKVGNGGRGWKNTGAKADELALILAKGKELSDRLAMAVADWERNGFKKQAQSQNPAPIGALADL